MVYRIIFGTLGLCGALICWYSATVGGEQLPGGGSGVRMLSFVFAGILVLCLLPWKAINRRFGKPEDQPDKSEWRRPIGSAATTIAPADEPENSADEPPQDAKRPFVTAKQMKAGSATMLLGGVGAGVLGLLGISRNSQVSPEMYSAAGFGIAAIGLIMLAMSFSDRSANSLYQFSRIGLLILIVLAVLIPVAGVVVLVFDW